MSSKNIFFALLSVTFLTAGCGGEPGRYYGNGFSIKFPSGWKQNYDSKDKTTSITASSTVPRADMAFITIFTEELSGSMDFGAFSAVKFNEFQQPGSPYSVLENTRKFLGNYSCKYLRWSLQGKFLGFSYLLVENDIGYIINCFAVGDKYYDFLSILKQAVDTFRIE